MGADSVKAAEALVADIETLLDDKPVEKPTPSNPDVNPFATLWSLSRNLWRWLSGTRKESNPPSLAADSAVERVLRSQAILLSRSGCGEAFEVFKHLVQGPARSE